MKNTIINVFFKALCLVLVSLMTLTLHAQPVRYAHIPQEEKEEHSLELINEADYVVEGKSKGFRYFYGEDEKTIYTEFTFEVSHWYKGRGENTISIIKKGGRIGNDNQSNHDSYMYPDRVMRHIILLKEGNKKDTYEFSRNISPVIIRSNDGYVWDGFYNLTFHSFEELTAFLSKAEQIRFPAKKKDVGFQKSLNPPVEIDDITPSVVRAGVGDVIVISGSGFGDTKGKVLFRNADFPETSLNGTPVYLDDLDDFYYDTSNPNGDNITGWKDDEIRVIVPSWVPSATGDSPGACSGRLKVVHANGMEDISDRKLIVEYAIANHSENTSDLTKNPVRYGYVGTENCLSGYVFTLHNSFEGNGPDKVDARASIEAALTAWRNILGITLELEKDADDNYVYANFTEAEHRIVISFVNQDALMTVRTGFEPDLWGSASYYRRVAKSIKIKNEAPGPNGVNWEFKHTGSIASGKSDFYAAFLHEVGHIIGVHHSVILKTDAGGNLTDFIDYNNIMSYALRSDQALSEVERLNLTNYNNNTTAVSGNLLVVNTSRNHNWSNAFKTIYGVETLVPPGNNSVVLPTPKIEYILNSDPPTYTIPVNSKATLKPIPLNPAYDYYWWWENTTLGNKTADQLTNVSVCSDRDYWVRIKNPSCSVSSLYSLPQSFPIRRCPPTGSYRGVELIVTPNPTSRHINISFDLLEEERSIKNTHIGIYDNLGGLQLESRIGDANSTRTTVNISELPAGTYWVVWFSGEGEVIATEQVQKIN